jgi:hypothetical protein
MTTAGAATAAALALGLLVAATAAAGTDAPPEIRSAKAQLIASGERVEFRAVVDDADKVHVRWDGSTFRLANDGRFCGDFAPGEPAPDGAEPPCNRFVADRPAVGRCYRFTVIATSDVGRDERRFKRCVKNG